MTKKRSDATMKKSADKLTKISVLLDGNGYCDDVILGHGSLSSRLLWNGAVETRYGVRGSETKHYTKKLKKEGWRIIKGTFTPTTKGERA